MAREMPFDFGANFTAVHVNRNITVSADIESSPCILVREPAHPPGPRIVAFGEATAMPSRSARSCCEAFHTASKV
jgi:hypothetical protein